MDYSQTPLLRRPNTRPRPSEMLATRARSISRRKSVEYLDRIASEAKKSDEDTAPAARHVAASTYRSVSSSGGAKSDMVGVRGLVCWKVV